jgi:predicted ATPase
VLDNFEHVLAARALVAALLTASPTVRFLVTSRTELSLSGEYVYPVAPLPQEDAVSLFVERAAQVGVAVSVDPTVAAICERLDRLPLAIELAAARVKLLAPAGLLDRLDVRLPMLRGGAADLPPRQQTLHAAIAWSHDLLDQDERVLFRRLSVFAGSFTLESAEAVADSDLWTLESLLSKSLVRRWSSDRFGLLETIREYAREQLEDAGESERFAAAHAQHYLDLALSLEPYLAAGDRRSDSTDQLATEFDNLRAALVHFESSDHGEQLLQLATALWRFWMARGYFGTGREWLERGLEIAEDASDDLRARALEGLGVMCMLGGDVDEGVRVTESALDLFRKLGDARGTAESLNNIGTAVMSNLDLERAERLFLEAADVARSAGELQVVALAIGNLAAVAVERGDDDGAIQLLNEETQIYSQVGDRGRVAMPLLTLGRMLVDQGRTGEAVRPLASGLAAADELPQREFAVMGVVTVAALAGGEGDGILAAQLLGAVDGLYEAAGASWRSSIPADRATRERAFERARKSAENDAFDVAYAAGRGLSFEQAIATALTALERLEDCESATAASTPRRSSPS